MSAHPAKRPRATKNEDLTSETSVKPSLDDVHIAALVRSLKPDATTNLLIAAAQIHPAVAGLVQREVNRLAEIERKKVSDFEYLSKSAWKTLNVTYDYLSARYAFDMSGQILSEVKGCWNNISDRCPKVASFETKKSALETLRKIGKSICLSDGAVGHEVRKDLQHDHDYVDVMRTIVEGLSQEETEALIPWCEEKLVELKKLGDANYIFEGLGQIIGHFGNDMKDEGGSISD